jgi:hypothetical protein
MLYSQSKRTISSVRLDGLLSKRLLYIDSIKRNVVVDRSRVSFQFQINGDFIDFYFQYYSTVYGSFLCF